MNNITHQRTLILTAERPFKWRHNGTRRDSLPLPEVNFDDLLARLAQSNNERQALTEYIEAVNLQAWEDAHFPRCRRPTTFPITEKTMRDHLDSLYPHPLQTTTDRHGSPTALPAWSVLLPTSINPQHHVFPDLARL
jgi:hypothetical protein